MRFRIFGWKSRIAKGSLQHFFWACKIGIYMYNFIFGSNYSLRTFLKFSPELKEYVRGDN